MIESSSFQESVLGCLLRMKFLTPDQASRVRETAGEEGKLFTTVLREMGFVKPETLACVVSFIFKVRIADVRRILVDPEALKLIPADFGRKHRLVPFGFSLDGSLLVAMENPQDAETVLALSAMTKREVWPHFPLMGISEADIDAVYGK